MTALFGVIGFAGDQAIVQRLLCTPSVKEARSVPVTIDVKNFSPLHWTIYTPLAILTCIVVGYIASLQTPAGKKDLAGLTIFTLNDAAAPKPVQEEAAGVV